MEITPPRYTLEIEASVNGKVGKATITARDANGTLRYTDQANLMSQPTRLAVARRIATALNADAHAIGAMIESKWSAMIDAAKGLGTPTTTEDSAKRTLSSEGCTDTGNAKRLVQRHGAELRYCHPWGAWLRWSGTHWQKDDTGVVMKLAKDAIRELLEWATAQMTAEDSDGEQKLVAKRIAEWAIKSLNVQRLKAMVELARCELPILPAELDRDRMLLNARNGTIDLTTGQLRQHDPKDYITRCCPVAYDPAALAPTWERCLQRWMDDDEEMVGYLRRSAGYSATGDVSEQCLYFAHGDGQNGKSTYLAGLLNVFGEYGCQTIAELLMQRHGESHPTERADLCGKRFVCTIETEDGRRMAEALVKQLTGGDKIRARRMRQDFWEFEPTHKLWLAANHKPAVKGTDFAIWRRVKVIPFTVTIPPDERDAHLGDKLKAEAMGILAWIVRGCIEWQRLGLAEPEQVTRATDTYRAEQDMVSAFLSDHCQCHPELRCRAGDLHTAYQTWSGDRMSQKEFGERIRARGFEGKKGTGGYVYWHGVGLPVSTADSGASGASDDCS